VSVELRPPRREDAAAIATALNEFNRTFGFDLDSPEEGAVWLEFPSFDLERDVRVAVVDGDDHVPESFEDWRHWIHLWYEREAA
jgi:hypothetical protein